MFAFVGASCFNWCMYLTSGQFMLGMHFVLWNIPARILAWWVLDQLHFPLLLMLCLKQRLHLSPRLISLSSMKVCLVPSPCYSVKNQQCFRTTLICFVALIIVVALIIAQNFTNWGSLDLFSYSQLSITFIMLKQAARKKIPLLLDLLFWHRE